MTDFYAILDIEKTVSEGEIKKAYRRLALVMHPDKNGAPGADEAFKCECHMIFICCCRWRIT